ncbi:MAG: hypothetical protein V1736_09720 [Pseudomonadota bacterium]
MRNEKALITAIEAVRRFSELLGNVRYRRNRYTIMENGKAIAVLRPADVGRNERTLADLPELLTSLPRLRENPQSFDEDMQYIVSNQPEMPEGKTWA